MRRISVYFGLFICVGLLSACDGGDPLSEVANRSNSYPPATNPVDDFNSGSTGDSSNVTGLTTNEVRVTVEVPSNVAPEGELTRRNLRIVTPDSISVYHSDNSLESLGSVNAEVRREDKGRSVITFAEGLPIAPNIIIEAMVGNTRMRALAADADRDVKINPFSEYLVRNSVGQYSNEEFERIIECAASTEINLCLNKYVWSALADQVHDFEIDIPDNIGIDEALDELAKRADFSSYVASVAKYALLGSSSAGIISASSVDYNSVFMGIELGQNFNVSSAENPGQWGVQVADEERVEDEHGVAYVYPALTLTSFDFLNIQITSLATDIPYTRATLAHAPGNNFYARDSNFWGINTHSTAPGAATLKDKTRLLAGRSMYQSITGKGSSQVIGWTRNPYFLDAWVNPAGSEPDRVLSGHFNAGKAIELVASEGKFKRQTALETVYTSALELNLQRKADFDAAILNGRRYNTIAMTTRFDDKHAKPLSVETMSGSWTINGGAIKQTADTTLLRRDNISVVSRQDSTRNEDYLLSARTSQTSTGKVDNGRLSLDVTKRSTFSDRPQIGAGASVPGGSFMAFNPHRGALGDGLLIAAEQHDKPIPTSGTYRVQGLLMSLADDSNRLSHFQGATLTIDFTTQATLSIEGFEVVHQVSTEQVAPPKALIKKNLLLSYTDNAKGKIRLSDASGNLTFDGFVSEDGEQMFLVASKNDGNEQALGLLIATKLPL